MPSAAANKYKILAARASIILKADRSSLSRQELQSVYGAAFVAQVAAWNAYVASLVGCFFQDVANPTIADFHGMHTLAKAFADAQLDRFSTPNAENTRNLIISCTGYDPWTDWQWPVRGMNALATRNRLNEILKVRHSLAHGSAMPGYSWNQTASGETKLTLVILAWTRSFFNHLVKTTDRGLSTHLKRVYVLAIGW